MRIGRPELDRLQIHVEVFRVSPTKKDSRVERRACQSESVDHQLQRYALWDLGNGSSPRTYKRGHTLIEENINGGVTIALKRMDKRIGESCRACLMPKKAHETISQKEGTQKQQRTSLEDEQQIFHRKKK